MRWMKLEPIIQSEVSQKEKHQYSMLLMLLGRISHVRLYATPETAAHQAPPSLGFSRQENWSGLPFPSPMHACYVASVVSDSVQPYAQQPTRLLCPQDSLGKNTGVGCHFLLPGLLHCRQILYCLSYQGSLFGNIVMFNL